ncbi:hypothetical protein M8C21_022737, partial [Ambrosia artemisiifolia]
RIAHYLLSALTLIVTGSLICLAKLKSLLLSWKSYLLVSREITYLYPLTLGKIFKQSFRPHMRKSLI